MPKTSSKAKPKWTQQQLEDALEAVNNGMVKRKAAEQFGIPWSTFCDKLSGRRKIDGNAPLTYLTPEEEEELVNYLKSSSDRGFGRTRTQLFTIVQDMLNARGRKTRWVDNLPSTKWYKLFFERHPELSLRKPQRLGKQRALLSKGTILSWFEQFSKTIKGIDATILLEPDRIFNCDESGFSLDTASGKVISYAGANFCYEVGSENKTMITVL